MEPRVPAGAWDGARGGPPLLLLSVDRPRRLAAPVPRRRPRGGGDGAPDVRRLRAPLPPAAAVPARVRLEGIARRRVRQARVGRTRRRRSLPPVAPRLLVRRFRDSPGSAGQSH